MDRTAGALQERLDLAGECVEALTAFDVELGGIRVAFGPGVLARLGREVAALGIRRPLVVTDRGVSAAGHAVRAIEALRAAGVTAGLHDGVEVNPTTRHVDEAVAAALAHGADGLIGLGGGSAMDCAKGANFLLTQGGRMQDYQGTGKAKRPMLPAVGVPTTAGTGSEGQSYALISDEKTKVKMACGDRRARFRVVLLDPELLVTVPRAVAAATGIDAVTHAVESYVSTRRNPISQMYGRTAWGLLERSLEGALAARTDLAAWGRMLLGAHLAGAAIEQSMLGAAHAAANPLTARFGVTHGVAVGLMLPHVMRFNAGAVGPSYDELQQVARGASAGLVERVLELAAAAGLPQRLRDLGVPAAALSGLADEAAAQWTAGFNPRPVGRAEFEELYAAAH